MASRSATERPPAFLHVDCDGLASVKSCYGPAGETDPNGDPFWREGIPAATDLLGEFGVPGTFFMISHDLEADPHAALGRQLIQAGHEVASHSHTHRMDMCDAVLETVRCEINHSCTVIENRLGVRPAGFRTPGFSWNPALPRELAAAGYLYDSSRFPSPWGPLLRLARAAMAKSGGARQRPYGSLQSGWGSRAPQRIQTEQGSILELPVALTPWLRLPAHASFALLRGNTKTERTIRWHAGRRLPFIFLIHLIDLCDTEGLDLPTPRWARRWLCQAAGIKRERLRRMLGWIVDRFDVQRTDAWVRSELNRL